MTDGDPFLWLEEIDSPAALAWVRAENARSLALLENDPRYPALLAEARAIITAPDLDSALDWGRKLARATTLPIEVRPFADGAGG